MFAFPVFHLIIAIFYRQNGRPRLRDRLKITSTEQLGLDTALGTTESYVAWCQVHQFPNVLSETVKTRLYFMAAQVTWDWRDHLQWVLRQPSDGICNKVAKYPVSQPDLGIMSSVIGHLCMDGTAPFIEMIDFKNRCFKSFPVSHVQKMNLSQVCDGWCWCRPCVCWDVLGCAGLC